jgi:hypothetical protein
VCRFAADSCVCSQSELQVKHKLAEAETKKNLKALKAHMNTLAPKQIIEGPCFFQRSRKGHNYG